MITGAAGFIAYHLSLSLLKDNHEVCGFDNFNDHYDVKLKHDRARILRDKGVNLVYTDLTHLPAVNYFLQEQKPDIVIHLGAYTGIRLSLEQPMKCITNNVVGTHNLIEACNKAGVDKVIYASTSCVMAGNDLPWKEDDKLGHQLNPYGYTKATNESQFMTSPFGFAIGLRFFTVYGPWGRPDMALFDFTKNIIKGNPIKLFNYGDMIRDFTHVDDIVQGIKIIINRVNNSPEPLKEVYNIGYGQKVNLMDFVAEIEKNVGKEAIKEMVEKHPADTHATWSDTTKLQALGYKPTTSIREGVAKFVEWYKDYYEVL